MSRTECKVRKFVAADTDLLAALLAEAFADNACYVFMHPRVERRASALRAFFRRNLMWHLPLDLSWVASTKGGEPLGTVTLEPPHGVPGPLSKALQHWALPTLREEGLQTLRRIVSTDGEFKRHYRNMCNGPAYWHVHAVAVAPAHQGRGVGRTLMATALAALRELVPARPAPVVLSTQRERNVAFYRSHGFELTHEATMGRARGEPGYTSWFMRYVSTEP